MNIPITCDICGEEREAKVHTDTELHPDDATDGLFLHPFTDPRERTMSTINISITDVQQAFRVNDLEVSVGKSFPELLKELGVEGDDMEILLMLAERLEAIEPTSGAHEIAAYADGFAAGIRSVRLALLGTQTPNES